MVRRLHLLRHAKSSWDHPRLSDRERPLNKRGRGACELLRAHLEAERIEPDAVLVSPAARTAETWERVRAGLPADTPSWTEPRIYAAATETVLDVVRELPDDFNSSLVIGHNPSIQGLAIALAAEGGSLPDLRHKYPTGALATLTFRGAWPALAPGTCELEAFVRPKDLG